MVHMANVLVVDDEAINLEILNEYFEGESNLQMLATSSGEAAWDLLKDPENSYHVVLLDRMMPGLDGIGLLKRLKADPRLAAIPVIMQTAAGSPEQIREGLEAGAYYYLTKPYRRDALLAIVHAALADAETRDALRKQLNQHVYSLKFMENAEFSIRTIHEATQLASFIAHACPKPDMAVMGISELLINGIEHGNLGLTYQEKSELKLNDKWHDEIERRSNLPENLSKRVRVSFRRLPQGVMIKVEDQGKGFDWQNYLEIDPARAFDPNGRGIALARMLSFSSIRYEGRGNIAVAHLADAQEADGAAS